jgi:hypothetical protein
VGATLRVLNEDRFAVSWSADGWKTVNISQSRSLGSAGYSVDISTANAPVGGELSWTLQWTEQGRWLGYNVNLKIETSQQTTGTM